MLGVGRRRQDLEQLHEERAPAHLFQVSRLGQLCGQGHQIRGHALTVEPQDGLVDESVAFVIEVFGGEDGGHVPDHLMVQEHGSKNTHLPFRTVGGHQPAGFNFHEMILPDWGSSGRN